MSLVSYENSDSEFEDDSDTENNNKVSQKHEVRKRVKIEIPHLSNFNNVEEPSKKVFIKTNHDVSSGLFNILPPPKHKPEEKNCKFDAAVVIQKNLVPRTVKTGIQSCDDNIADEEISKGNYFFTNCTKAKTINVVNSSLPLNITINSAKPIHNNTSVKTNAYFSNLISKSIAKTVPKSEESKTVNDTEDKVVDLNSSEFKTNWKMNVLKEKTSSVSSNSCKNDSDKEEPSLVSKRKHQITYLAYQAKKNEEQLKTQWAMNKMTRRQSQSKYGF